MSRFNSLEFNHAHEGAGEGEQTSSAGLKDEHFYLAEAHTAFANAQFEAALRAYARVLEHNAKLPAAWTGQVRALIELGEFPEAKLWADKALERFPTEPELLAAKAVALARIGNVVEALAFSDAAMEEKGDTPYVWLARGDVLLARAEKRADYCFDRARALAPTDWLIHWLAARIYFFYEKASLALRHAQQALALNSSADVAWLQAGQCQSALGLFAAAQHSFTQALELNPRCVEAEREITRLSTHGFFQRTWRRIFSR
jgi:tetratricopeptide (TPR) repeat protein